MRTVLVSGPLGEPTYASVTVKTNQDDNRFIVDYLQRPEPVYGYEVSDNSPVSDEIIGYDEGEAVITVCISGDSAPDPTVFGTMVRDFFISTGFMWTSEFEQDVLAEVYSVTKI